MKISIIVPCYNEEKNIECLVERFQMMSLKMDLELILVDNGSSDSTLEKINDCISKYNFVKKVVVKKNIGYGYGILSGLKVAEGNWLGWMHADLQSDPDVFLKMMRMASLEKGDFLYKGRRANRPVLDRIFTFGMSVYETIYLHKKLWDINAQPTLISRRYYEKWDEPPYDFSFDLYVYYYAQVCGIKIRRFLSPQKQRLNGKSTWNTGMKARIKLVKRVISYSRQLKIIEQKRG